MADKPTIVTRLPRQPSDELDTLVYRANGLFKGMSCLLENALVSAGAASHNTDLEAATIVGEALGDVISDMVDTLDRRDGMRR